MSQPSEPVAHRMHGMIGRRIVDAWYNPSERCDVIVFEDGWVQTTYRHPAKVSTFFPVGFRDDGPAA